jgi:hypothetical protein
MEQNDTKFCKMCYQQIDSRARRCPFCHHWQNKLSSIVSGPTVAVIVLVIALIVPTLLTRHILDKGKDFGHYKNQVQIAQSQLTFGKNVSCPSVIVLGRLKNTGNVSWKSLQFEATFFDHKGKLMDTGQDEKYFFILKAKSEAPFKVSLKREFPVEDYASYAIRIISAKDADALF